jgi:hypothetical protein
MSKLLSITLVAILFLVMLGSSALMLFSFPSSAYATATTTTTSIPFIKGAYGGYEMGLTGSLIVVEVTGQWVVPSLSCPATGGSGALYTVGIDWVASSTLVVQVQDGGGILMQCISGKAFYTGVYLLGAKLYNVPGVTVLPGDHMSSTTIFNTTLSAMMVTVKDTTRPWQFTKVLLGGCGCYYADWIMSVDAPPVANGGYLANFGHLHTSGDKAIVPGLNNNKLDTIGGFASILTSGYIDARVLGYPGYPVLAKPSLLSSSGGSFTMIWKSKGPI